MVEPAIDHEKVIGRSGHDALSGPRKFAAEKQPLRFGSPGPAKTIDEETIDSLIGAH